MKPLDGILPRGLSTFAPAVDGMFLALALAGVLVFAALVAALVTGVLRSRRNSTPRSVPARSHAWLQVVWIGVIAACLAGVYHQGAAQFLDARIAPADATPITAVASASGWEFRHASGYVEHNEVHVPALTPVEFTLSTTDGPHTFRVDELRVQRDVRPGVESTLWFQATATSDADALSIRDRALDEGSMMREAAAGVPPSMRIVTLADYQALLRDGPPMPAICSAHPDPDTCWGRELYTSSGCIGCHSTDPARNAPGPSWATTWGATRVFVDGSQAVADADYVRQSIREPQSHVVRGYEAVQMPRYELSDRQIAAITSFIASLKR